MGIRPRINGSPHPYLVAVGDGAVVGLRVDQDAVGVDEVGLALPAVDEDGVELDGETGVGRQVAVRLVGHGAGALERGKRMTR